MESESWKDARPANVVQSEGHWKEQRKERSTRYHGLYSEVHTEDSVGPPSYWQVYKTQLRSKLTVRRAAFAAFPGIYFSDGRSKSAEVEQWFFNALGGSRK